MTTLLGNNSFNRGVGVFTTSSVGFTYQKIEWSDIQPAIDHAPTSGPDPVTVSALAGKYFEKIKIGITGEMVLQGVQSGHPGTSADRESSAPSISEIVVTKSTDQAIVITGGLVTIDGFDITSSSVSTPGSSSLPAVQVSGGTATLENNVIEAGGVGVEVDQGAAAGWWIKANYIYMKYDAASSGYAIKMGGGSLDGQITSNDILGNGLGGGAGGTGAGIYMVSDDTAQVSIVSNTIRESPTGMRLTRWAADDHRESHCWGWNRYRSTGQRWRFHQDNDWRISRERFQHDRGVSYGHQRKRAGDQRCHHGQQFQQRWHGHRGDEFEHRQFSGQPY